MISNDHAFTATNKIKWPSYSTVVIWVKDSWEEVSVDLIKNSFKCYGISTKLDGSEDDLLFDYENLLDPVDDDEEIEVPNDQNSDKEYFEEDNYKNNGLVIFFSLFFFLIFIFFLNFFLINCLFA